MTLRSAGPLVGAATALLGGVVVLAGCSVLGGGAERSGNDVAGAAIGSSEGPSPVRARVLTQPRQRRDVAPGTPLTLQVSYGRLAGVGVSATGVAEKAGSDSRRQLAGTIGADGQTWTSSTPMVPSSTYRVDASVIEGSGATGHRRLTITTAPPEKEILLSLAPVPDSTVGVAAPIVIYFDDPITNRKAVEQALHVRSSKPAGPGAWHWFSDTEVQYRPQDFWPAGTTVTLRGDIAGVDAGAGLWGMRDREMSFHVGAAMISTVDGRKDTFTVRRNGTVIRRMPTSLGKKGYRTWEGILVTTEMQREIRMTSRSVGIFGPDAYDLGVRDAVRVTDSGTFVHAAPWDTQLGRANTSHGCIHLSDEDAAWFFDHTRRGDAVIVHDAFGQPVPAHNGYSGWNLSWRDWQAGSAL